MRTDSGTDTSGAAVQATAPATTTSTQPRGGRLGNLLRSREPLSLLDLVAAPAPAGSADEG